jgi:uncharacterized spore protein YtfJ
MDIEALLAKATNGASSGTAYGPVIERDDCTVIPAAYVLSAGGGGGGEGPSGEDCGSGGGLGTFSLSWPVGAYVVRNGEAKWVPAFDATRVAVIAFGIGKLVVKARALRRATS